MSAQLVLCMKWGARYPAIYVNRLLAMVTRNMEQPVQLVCFTDDPTGIDAGVDIRPLPPFPDQPASHIWTPWRKLSLWSGALDADLMGRDALFFDLDVVVTGPLDRFFDHEPGRYVVIENWTKAGEGIGNTSVFRFPVGAMSYIYDRYAEDPAGVIRDYNIEQEFISQYLSETGRGGLQAYWPADWVVSFKESLLPAWPQRIWTPAPLPESASVVVFHGKPDPEEAAEGRWPAPIWKKHYKTIAPARWISEHWR
ncbi:MAG: hypothetical protein ACFE0P_10085 [Oceanicaulis sp.]